MNKTFILLGTLSLLGLLYCNSERNMQEPLDYRIMGDSISKMKFNLLSQTLMETINQKGFGEAINYCNVNAASLTNANPDENYVVRRTALRLRNTDNKPSQMEEIQLLYFKQMIDSGKVADSKIVADQNGLIHYYSPILLKPACLSCHGSMDQINPEALLMIQEKYPDDEATGFKAGDLRGMWHIEFYKKS